MTTQQEANKAKAAPKAAAPSPSQPTPPEQAPKASAPDSPVTFTLAELEAKLAEKNSEWEGKLGDFQKKLNKMEKSKFEDIAAEERQELFKTRAERLKEKHDLPDSVFKVVARVEDREEQEEIVKDWLKGRPSADDLKSANDKVARARSAAEEQVPNLGGGGAAPRAETLEDLSRVDTRRLMQTGGVAALQKHQEKVEVAKRLAGYR